MEIRVKRADNPLLWYTSFIGETFYVTKVTPAHYSVQSGPYIKLINKADAEVNDGSIYVRVIRCTNPVMWYNGHEASIFKVIKEDETAYWVQNKPGYPVPISFIYKQDCEVLE